MTHPQDTSNHCLHACRDALEKSREHLETSRKQLCGGCRKDCPNRVAPWQGPTERA